MKNKTKPIRILLVEDHAVVREGLKAILEQNPKFEIVGEVGTCQEARTQVGSLKPDVILMDLRMPDGNGVELCREVIQNLEQTRVLFLTSHGDDESMLSAVMAGASGYLLKEITPERLVQSIEMVAGGHTILDHQVVLRVQAWIKEQQEKHVDQQKDSELSNQQERVLALVADGKTNKEIANILNLSEKTVRNYLSIIFEKLQITRRTQAAAFFARRANE